MSVANVSEGNAGRFVKHQSPDLEPQLDHIAQIEEFFTYRPKTFFPAKNHTDSDKTRAPAKFDRHLDDSLRLRHVVYMPSLVDDLKNLAEAALKSASDAGTLPSISKNFPNPKKRGRQFQKSRFDRIVDESCIQNIYGETTATFCAIVASTLEFRLPCWSCGHLEWTVNSDKSCGIADAFLRLDKTAVDNDIPPLPVEWITVAKHLPVLALWEFKNLKAGSLNVFEAIVQQSAGSKEFPWEGCKDGPRCRIVHKMPNGDRYVTRPKTGFDASRENETCKSILSDARLTPNSPTIQLDELVKLRARYVTQQTWAEAVNEDTTFVVINADNVEIIGKRERATQTLYISDVINVAMCEYGKLHTGLFIAAIRDAQDRTAQLLRCDPRPASQTIDCTRKTNSTARVGVRSLLKNILACDWLSVVRNRSYKYPFPFFHDSYWIRTPPSTTIEQARESMEDYFIELSVFRHLGSDTFKGRLRLGGTPFEGIKGEFAKTVVIKYASTENAIERLQHEHQMLQKLEKTGVTATPKVIGLFNFYRMMEDPGMKESNPLQRMTALVMEDAGDHLVKSSLSNRRRHIPAFVKALNSIHKCGYLHGNIKGHNLVLRNNIKLPEEKQGVAIVGFGDALSEPSKKEQSDEHESLMWLFLGPS